MKPHGGKTVLNDYSYALPGSTLIGQGSSLDNTDRTFQEGVSKNAEQKLRKKMYETIEQSHRVDLKGIEGVAGTQR